MNFHVKAARAAVSALALAVGLAWEKVFDAAMDAVGDMVSKNITTTDHTIPLSELVQIFFTYFYLLIVFPAWMMYILPKTDPDIQKKMSKALADGPLPCRACFCDSDLYDDVYEGYDEEMDDLEEEPSE